MHIALVARNGRPSTVPDRRATACRAGTAARRGFAFLASSLPVSFLLAATSAMSQCYEVTADAPEPISVRLEFNQPPALSPPGGPLVTGMTWIKSTLTMSGKSYSSTATAMVVSPVGGIVSSVPGTTDAGDTGWAVSLLTYSRPWSNGPALTPEPQPLSTWEDAYISLLQPKGDPKGYKIASIQRCGQSKGRIYFFITYVNKDKDLKCKDSYGRPCYQSFIDAAETWRRNIEKLPSFRKDEDIFIRAYVRTAVDFVDAWQHVAQEAKRTSMQVQQGGLFTHTSYLAVETGIEFTNAPGAPKTSLNQQQISDLPALPWVKETGLLEVHGCNSASPRGIPPWSPSGLLARTQNVRTTGEAGWSYFSKHPDRYYPIDPSTTEIYLHAYPTGRNTLGVPAIGGYRIPVVVWGPG